MKWKLRFKYYVVLFFADDDATYSEDQFEEKETFPYYGKKWRKKDIRHSHITVRNAYSGYNIIPGSYLDRIPGL